MDRCNGLWKRKIVSGSGEEWDGFRKTLINEEIINEGFVGLYETAKLRDNKYEPELGDGLEINDKGNFVYQVEGQNFNPFLWVKSKANLTAPLLPEIDEVIELGDPVDRFWNFLPASGKPLKQKIRNFLRKSDPEEIEAQAEAVKVATVRQKVFWQNSNENEWSILENDKRVDFFGSSELDTEEKITLAQQYLTVIEDILRITPDTLEPNLTYFEELRNESQNEKYKEVIETAFFGSGNHVWECLAHEAITFFITVSLESSENFEVFYSSLCRFKKAIESEEENYEKKFFHRFYREDYLTEFNKVWSEAEAWKIYRDWKGKTWWTNPSELSIEETKEVSENLENFSEWLESAIQQENHEPEVVMSETTCLAELRKYLGISKEEDFRWRKVDREALSTALKLHQAQLENQFRNKSRSSEKTISELGTFYKFKGLTADLVDLYLIADYLLFIEEQWENNPLDFNEKQIESFEEQLNLINDLGGIEFWGWQLARREDENWNSLWEKLVAEFNSPKKSLLIWEIGKATEELMSIPQFYDKDKLTNLVQEVQETIRKSDAELDDLELEDFKENFSRWILNQLNALCDYSYVDPGSDEEVEEPEEDRWKVNLEEMIDEENFVASLKEYPLAVATDSKTKTLGEKISELVQKITEKRKTKIIKYFTESYSVLGEIRELKLPKLAGSDLESFLKNEDLDLNTLERKLPNLETELRDKVIDNLLRFLKGNEEAPEIPIVELELEFEDEKAANEDDFREWFAEKLDELAAEIKKKVIDDAIPLRAWIATTQEYEIRDWKKWREEFGDDKLDELTQVWAKGWKEIESELYQY